MCLISQSMALRLEQICPRNRGLEIDILAHRCSSIRNLWETQAVDLAPCPFNSNPAKVAPSFSMRRPSKTGKIGSH